MRSKPAVHGDLAVDFMEDCICRSQVPRLELITTIYQAKAMLFLVGGILTPLKNMKVNWKDDIPYIMENKSHVP